MLEQQSGSQVNQRDSEAVLEECPIIIKIKLSLLHASVFSGRPQALESSPLQSLSENSLPF